MIRTYTRIVGAVDYGECDYGGFYGECDYGGCVSVRVWVRVCVRVWARV